MKTQLKNILSATCFGFLWLLGAQSVSALPLNEVAKLLASDGASFDQFGYSVAVSGDIAVIGARLDDDKSGLAYLFVRSSGVWSQQAKLRASDGAAGDHFGVSVAVSGNTAVIGAYLDDGKGSSSGSAYVFDLSGATGTVTEVAKLRVSEGAANDYFGYSVAVSGNTAVIGAPTDGGAPGSAYVFDLSGATGTVTEVAKLLASDGAAGDQAGPSVAVSGKMAMIGDQFGHSVAVSGNTAVIGAHLDDDKGSSSGSAYIFDLSGATGTVTEVAKLLASDGAANDYFGYSVAVSGNTAVIGARLDDDKGSSSGSAYVFDLSGAAGTVTEVAKLLASDGTVGDQAGYSVTVSGNTAVVGARIAGGVSSSAYVFDLTGATGTVNEIAKLRASDGAASDQFANSVAVSGNTAVIGARLADDNGTRSGSAYVFSLIFDEEGPGHK